MPDITKYLSQIEVSTGSTTETYKIKDSEAIHVYDEATSADIRSLFSIKPYLTFRGTKSFTLGTSNGGKWKGAVEYSTDKTTWNTWYGLTTLSSGTGNVLYLRGTNNTRFATSSSNYTKFVFNTSGTIDCIGDIRVLLDYEAVLNGIDPTMGPYCYYSMFNGCTSLTTAPALPATTLASFCYQNMFNGCTSLTTAPKLPATTLDSFCYENMFNGCTSLTTAPALPATTLADSCYAYMFNGCTSLTTAPALPATTLDSNCYYMMFLNCTSLTTAPKLPATTLTADCYHSMFQGCTSLTTAPALPATTLDSNCYYMMFRNCTSLTTIPALPATTLASYCYYEMFRYCTNIKLSTTTQTGVYNMPYRIPTAGTGTTATNALTSMFSNTGGTYSGTPSINTMYYANNTIIPAS